MSEYINTAIAWIVGTLLVIAAAAIWLASRIIALAVFLIMLGVAAWLALTVMSWGASLFYALN